jgi:TPR repeat protein
VVALVGLVALAILAGPHPAPGQGRSSEQNVRDDLNRARAALHGQRYPEAVQRFERLAAAGNAEAQFFLGQMSATGRGVPKDAGKAFYWYDRSAQGGYLEGQAAVGSAYLRGLGVERNLVQAAHWSRLAAERGHGGAAYNLAVIYRSGGEGVAQDRAEAEKWAKAAMAKGFPDAMKVTTAPRKERSAEAVALFQQGRTLYQSGDMAAAARVFGQCATLGDARCQLQYGWHCEEGKGVPKSDAEAVRWYRAAADQGDPTAQVNLGNLYQAGLGVTKSCKTAVEWFARAA